MVFSILAKALVTPHFGYCITLWIDSNTILNSLQIRHNRLACILLSADIWTRIDETMKSLNWVRLK